MSSAEQANELPVTGTFSAADTVYHVLGGNARKKSGYSFLPARGR
jgi:hypothetical protein